MGRWFAGYLIKDGREVVITGRNKKKLLEAGQQLGIESAGNEEAVSSADVVVISVPLDNFERVVEEISPFTHSGQVILDVTSVKVFPVEVMHRLIKKAQVLGVHPMFGPGARDIANQNFVLTPTNGAEETLAKKVREYLETRGARVTLMSPEEHDEMMTVVLGLSHFIAIASADTLLSFNGLRRMGEISGSTYKVLLTLAEGVISEDPEFYASLQMNLPGIAEVEGLFQKRVKEWAELVAGKDRTRFTERMHALKGKLKESGSDFGKGYENMYKIVEGLER